MAILAPSHSLPATISNAEQRVLSATPLQKGGAHLPQKPYHSRKAHPKSRAGCDACKKRRKKCDESRPQCHRCLDHGIDCQYTVTEKPLHIEQVLLKQSPAIVVTNHGLPWSNAFDLQLLHHFHSHTLVTLGSPAVQMAIQTSMATAFGVEHVRHAILALSAAHMMFLSNSHRLELKHLYHCEQAFLSFRQEISAGINPREVDALFLTCVLLNTTTFSSKSYDPSKSWLFSRQSDVGWLTVQAGLRSLVFEHRKLLKQSTWRHVVEQKTETFHGDHPGPFEDERSGSKDIPPTFLHLFGIKEDSNRTNNVYHPTVRLLTLLLDTDPAKSTITQQMAFIHRIKPEFYTLLKAKDPLALLILTYWLGSMCSVQLWWVSNRARSECRACCAYLDANGDSITRGFLEFPAQCCGYKLGRNEAEYLQKSFVRIV